MKKETFINIINAIMAQEIIDRRLEKNLAPFFDGNMICTMSTKFTLSLIKCIENEFEDGVTDIISWWLYDAPEAGKDKSSAWIEDGGVCFSVENPGELYDFLSRT